MRTKQLAWGLACILVAAWVARAGQALVVGSGCSTAADPKSAGAEAARKARAALGDHKPRLVLVYNAGKLGGKAPALLDGVASVFDPQVLYGCNGYAPLTHETSDATVAVLALAGGISVTAAVAETKGKDDDEACGRRIAEQLKAAAATKAPGKLLLLFGDCHVPRNGNLVKGVCRVLGENFPIIGGAAVGGRLYVQGKVQTKANLGLLITGNFTCGFGLEKDMSREGLIASARQALSEALAAGKKKPALVFVFDCGGRRGAMLRNKNFPEELKTMKEVAGTAPLFGFYGSGEIGCPTAGAKPQGVGYHIAACALFAQ